MSGGHTSIDELLDRAVAAINRGDRATATALAGQVLAVDSDNPDAENLLAAPVHPCLNYVRRWMNSAIEASRRADHSWRRSAVCPRIAAFPS